MPETSSISPETVVTPADPLAQPLPARLAMINEWLAGEPMVPPALGLAAGIWLDATRHVPLLLACFLFVASGALLCFLRRSSSCRHLCIALAALSAGAPLHDLAYRHWPANHVVRYCAESTPARLTGTIISSPLLQASRSGRITWIPQQSQPHTRTVVAAEKLEGVRGDIDVSGEVAVVIFEPALRLAAGDRVEVFGTLSRPALPDNPGQRDWSVFRRRNGILAEMSCELSANVRILAGGAPPWMARLQQRARAAMLDQAFPGEVPGSRLLEALVLGQRSAVDRDMNQAFVDTGTVHYLSVSGAHVGMLASAVWGIAWVFGASRRRSAALAMILLTAYAALAEPNPPVLRSTIMADVLCLAVLLRRPVRTANWLALSALVLLGMQPTQLFDAGFQLSFVTLMGLIYLSPPIHRGGSRLLDVFLRRNDPLLRPEVQQRINPPRGWRKLRVVITDAFGWYLAVALAAWMAGALLGTYHFGQVAVWGWLNTILIMPLVWLTLVVGLLKTLLGVLFPPAAVMLGWPLAGVTQLLIGSVHLLAAVPGCTFCPPAVPLWLLLAGLGLLACWALVQPLLLNRRWLTTSTLVLVIAAFWQLRPYSGGNALRVHVLSVGNGLACLLQLPNGKTLLYDIGSNPPFDIFRSVIAPLLARERVYKLDALVLSHPDLDHFSAAPDLLDRRRVDALITAPQFDTMGGAPAQRLQADLQNRRMKRLHACHGEALSGTGDAHVEVLWPPPAEQLAITNTNDASLVLRISYGGKRLLLCGDIQDQAQRELMKSADLRADVLLLPHHGGVTTTTASFIQAVAPSICLCSESLRTSRRRTQTILPCSLYDTATHGAIELSLEAENITVRTARPRHEPP